MKWLAFIGILFGFASVSVAAKPAEKILRMGNGVEPQDLDPQRTSGNPEGHIFKALFEGLIRRDQKTMEPRPGVALRWQESPDRRTWRFFLRSDAKWSNGDPVTCEDFRYSWRRLLDPATGAPNGQLAFYIKGARAFYQKTGAVEEREKNLGLKCASPTEWVVTLEEPVPFFLDLIDHYSFLPLHRKIIEKHGDRWTKPSNFISNGPFRLVAWETMVRVSVRKSPFYWDSQSVKLDGIDFLPVESGDTEEKMFQTGQMDITATVPFEKLAFWEKNPAFISGSANGIAFYRLNIAKPPLDNPKVRRALALAVNREQIVKYVTKGNQEVLQGFTPPFVLKSRPPGQLTKGKEGFEEAKRLLAEAGYSPEKPLPPVEILINKSETHSKIAEAVQNMWKVNLGVTATIRAVEWKVFMDAIQLKQFQIGRTNWLLDFPDPQAYLENWLSSSPDNTTGYHNPLFEQRFHEALKAKDVPARLAAFAQAEEILLQDLPMIPLYITKLYALKSPAVKGFTLNSQGFRDLKKVDLVRP